MEKNPYAAPRAHVDDVRADSEGDYVAEGIGRPVARGFAWIADGFRIFFQSPGTWLGIGFLYMLIFLVLQYGPLLLMGAAGSPTGMMIGAFLSAILIILLFPVFTAGIMAGCHDLTNGESLSIGHLFRGFSMNPGRLMLMGVLYFVGFIIVIVIVGLLTGGMAQLFMTLGGGAMGGGMGGTSALMMVLLMLALILPLLMAIWFAPALIGINDEPTVGAMINSFKGCLKNFLPFLVYGIALLVIIIVLGMIFGLIAGLLMGMLIRPDFSGGGMNMNMMIMGMLSGILVALMFGLILLPIIMGSMYSSYRDIYYEGGGQ